MHFALGRCISAEDEEGNSKGPNEKTDQIKKNERTLGCVGRSPSSSSALHLFFHPRRVRAAMGRMPQFVLSLHHFESWSWGRCAEDAAPRCCLDVSKAAGEKAREGRRRTEGAEAIFQQGRVDIWRRDVAFLIVRGIEAALPRSPDSCQQVLPLVGTCSEPEQRP